MVRADFEKVRAGSAETPCKLGYSSVQVRLEARNIHRVRFDSDG